MQLLIRRYFLQLMMICSIIFFSSSSVVFAQSMQLQKSISPAQEWLDNKGKPINAHGGGILFFNGIYYWYGEHKIAGKSEADFADGGIHCYSSTDLINWTDVGIVLGVDYNAVSGDLQYGCLIERPKVVFNKKTGKFIAYFKFYPKGDGYEVAYVGVAISESPSGPFRYSHKFLGAGSSKGSGDFSMFLDDNGDLFHLTVRKPDKVFVIGKMRDDFLLPQTEYEVCKGVTAHTEAPALIKKDGIYHMIGSGSSGWKPNTARHFTSTSLHGPWKAHGNPCLGYNNVDGINQDKTFGGQSSFIFPIQGMSESYVAMFDIWKPELPIKGRYIWLPFKIKDEKISINWTDKWDLSIFKEIK
jgi:hypothetical protein